MRPLNRRSLLKGAAGVIGAAGAAALSPLLLDSPIAQAASPPPSPQRAPMPGVTPLVLPTTAGMQYAYLSGLSFTPQTSSTTWAQGGAGAICWTGGGTSWWFSQQVDLPKGAIVQEIRYQVVKNDSNAFYIEGDLYDPSSGTWSTKYNGAQNPTATASVQSIPASFTPFSCDPAQNTMRVWWMPPAAYTHVLFGVRVGYTFPGGTTVMLPSPIRVLDTRGESPGAQYNSGGPLADGVTRTYGPFAALPPDATGIVANLTAVGWGGAAGYLTIFPAGASRPPTSSLNFSTGAYAWANSVNAGFGTGANAGKVSIFASVGGGSVQVLLDIVGYTRAT